MGNIYEKAGAGDEYKVLSQAYSPHFYQNIWYSDGSCEQWTGIPNGAGGFTNYHEIGCGGGIYAPGSGTITSYTNWVVGDQLHEAMWQGGVGYIRENDIEANGTVDWNGTWVSVGSGGDVGGQGGFVLGDRFSQHIYSASGDCEEYHWSLNDDGAFYDGSGPNTCHSQVRAIPGSGNVTTYTNYIFGDKMYEAMWRGGAGYLRTSPISDNGTVNWGGAGNWVQCCTAGGRYYVGQGAYILWHR